MARVVKSKTGQRKIDVEAAQRNADIQAFLSAKKLADEASKVMKNLQPKIVEWLKEDVEADEKGNHIYPLPEPIAGYASLSLIRAVKNGTDAEAIERIATDHGKASEWLKVVTVPDEDALAAAALNGDISDEEMAVMFPQTVSFRLTTPKN